jgi:hypothetical protein
MSCPEITNAIDELESNGYATRSWAMAGLYLGYCERCPEWLGSGCRKITSDPNHFAEFLTDARRWCDRWADLHGAG